MTGDRLRGEALWRWWTRLGPPILGLSLAAVVAAATTLLMNSGARNAPPVDRARPLATATPLSLAPTLGPQRADAPPLASAGGGVVWDEAFATNQRGWPDSSASTAWLAPDGYHLAAREPGRFVAVEPAADPLALRTVQVTASFRKVGGPPGGGYGIIVHDQGPGPRDGLDQTGRYQVLEVGDRGEVGIWRRENTSWVDLVPWQAAPAVRPGTQANELLVRANGPELLLLVNGVEVARCVDPRLTSGSVGVFAGGDGNEALLSRLVVETPG